MKDVTVTIYIKPDDMPILIHTIEILDGLDIVNDYEIQPSDITYTELFNSSYIQMNLPLRLYLLFRNCYNRSERRMLKA